LDINLILIYSYGILDINGLLVFTIVHFLGWCIWKLLMYRWQVVVCIY